MKKVLLRAPLLSVSGYGVHCRQVFKWLLGRYDVELYCQVVQWGNTSWMINSDMEDGIVGSIMDHSKELSGKADVSIQVQLPDEWDSDLAHKNIGISAVIETDMCNPVWIHAMNKMDAVVVPSEHVRDIILNTGPISTNLFVIPEWYYENIDKSSIDELDIDFDTSFNFLTVAQFTGNDAFTDRKNLYFTLKWFCDAFSNDPEVGLVLKTNHGKGSKIDRQITRNKVRQVLGEVRKGPYPKIHLVHGNMTSDEIISLYRHSKIKALISLTRGEGFGLPLLESAACELPVVATNWSAHLDFLNLGRFIPINYSLCNIPDNKVDGRIFIEGMKWADPSEKDFKLKIKKLRNKYDIPKQWAVDLSKKVKSQFNSESIISQYDDMLNKTLGENSVSILDIHGDTHSTAKGVIPSLDINT